MKWLQRLYFFLPFMLIASHNSNYLEDQEKSSDPVITKILIHENIEGALIEVSDAYIIKNLQTDKTIASSSKGKRYYLHTNNYGIKWGESFPGVHQIKIIPKNENTTILIDGIQYKGSMAIYDIQGQLQIVNEISPEELLQATLPLMLSKTNYQEATYESLATLARTNLYFAILKSDNPFWHLHKNELNYQGNGTIQIFPTIERAIKNTKHIIITYKDQPFLSSWTENSAGRTASYASIYRKKTPSPEGVLVGYSQKKREDSHWKCSFSLSDFSNRLGLSSLVDTIDLFQDPSSKKVYAARIGCKASFIETTIFDLRKLLGEERLKSNDFNVRLIKDQIIFEGYGQGYGVGLCLLSADQMAAIGDTMPQILSYFFPESALVRLERLPKTKID